MSRFLLALIPCVVVVCSCRVVPALDPAIRHEPPLICKWQKKNSIGRTNAEQRWKDFQECGVVDYRDGVLDLNQRVAGTESDTEETIIEKIMTRSQRIKLCMMRKDYIPLTPWDCTDNRGKSTGKCNCETPEDLKQ